MVTVQRSPAVGPCLSLCGQVGGLCGPSEAAVLSKAHIYMIVVLGGVSNRHHGSCFVSFILRIEDDRVSLDTEPSKYSHSPTVRKGGVVPLLERRLGRVRDYAGVSPADPLKPPVSPWRARSLRSGVEG